MSEKIINVRDTSEYGVIEDEIMKVFDKYELNYVEALGVLETLKASIFGSYLREE